MTVVEEAVVEKIETEDQKLRVSDDPLGCEPPKLSNTKIDMFELASRVFVSTARNKQTLTS